jgi:hypothetical protein
MRIAMRPLAIAGFLCALGFLPAHATETRIQISGHFWADGGFPPTLAGGQLQAVGMVNAIDAPLYWIPDHYSYTWYLRDLVATNIDLWGPTADIEYAGGQITIYRDALPSNADYGMFPTNATVPSTFTDGSAEYLTGRVLWARLFYSGSNFSGSFEAGIQFTGGNAYAQLEDPMGWTIGSTLSGVPGVSPPGYAGQLNGSVYLDGPTARQVGSWASVKALYR